MMNAANRKIARTIFDGIKNGQNADTGKIRDVLKNIPEKDQRKVISYLKDMIHVHEEIIHTTVSTPDPLDPDTKERIRGSIKHQTGARDVVIEEVIDKTLLGGLKILVQDALYDNTVKRRLNQLRNQFR